MNSFYCFDHQGKAKTLIDALLEKYRQVEKGAAGILFALTDNDVAGRKTQLDRLKARGARAFFVYPHSGRVNLYADFYQTWEHTTAQFVSAEGHVSVMRSYGYAKPLHVIGWHLCPILPFKPTAGRRVLFAPIHPRMAEMDKKANLAAFQKLVELKRRADIELTVRFIGDLTKNGLPRLDDVTYQQGSLQPDWEGIDKADVIVAHQTFGYLAAARGKPLIGLGEDLPPHTVHDPPKMKIARHWDRYKHLVRYPFDILDTLDASGLLQKVSASDYGAEWRERMIGKPFDPQEFLKIVEGYIGT